VAISGYHDKAGIGMPAKEEEATLMIRIITVATALALCVLAGGSFAQSPSCKMQSAEKKLAGAAQTSFMKKCETDAKSACDKEAADKKLAGAAKTSFTKKCVTDAVGT
jgi:hypothetical protein